MSKYWLEQKFEEFQEDTNKKLSDVGKLKISPTSFVDNFFEWFSKKDHLFLPSKKYIESLKGLEPILYHTGKRGHYIHMFNCLILGNVILYEVSELFKWEDSLFSELQKYWFLISLNHDIAYPLELIEDEVTTFLEYYFHRGYMPQVSVGKEFYFGYDNFGGMIREIVSETGKIMQNGGNIEDFESLLIFNLMERVDHAIVSALLTMRFINEEWDTLRNNYGFNENENGEVSQIVGTSIALHNLHQWKYHALQCLFEVTQANPCPRTEKELKEKSKLLAYLQSRNKGLNNIFKKNTTGQEDIKWKKVNSIIKEIEASIQKVRINPIKACPSSWKKEQKVAFLTFLLTIVDSLQEWGRDPFLRTPLKLLSIRKINSDSDKLVIQLLSPHVKIAGKPDEDTIKGDTPIDNVIANVVKSNKNLQFKASGSGTADNVAEDPEKKSPIKELPNLTKKKDYYKFIKIIEDKLKQTLHEIRKEGEERGKKTLDSAQCKRRASQYNMIKTYLMIKDRLMRVFELDGWQIELKYLNLIKQKSKGSERFKYTI